VDAGVPSCHPDDLPKGYRTASRGELSSHAPDPKSAPLSDAVGLHQADGIARRPPLKETRPHDHLDTFRSLNDTGTAPNDHRRPAFVIREMRGHRIYQQPTETVVRESAGSGFESLAAHHSYQR
jgi:hypothetical protein